MVDFAKMKFPAQIGGQVLQGGDVAVFADQGIHALAEAGRQLRLIHLYAGYRDTFDCVALIDVTFGDGAIQFFACEDPATEREHQKRKGCARHCRSHSTPPSSA
jgi:hypothetical protein